MTTQKSRKNPRAPVTLLARYRSPTAFEYVEDHCSDLSSGGMFIESSTPAPAGTLIKLECDVNDGAGTLKGVARVVWLRETEADGQPRGMGVKFLKLEPGGRELILQLLGERASLPPTDSIPASRRSWSPSMSGTLRMSGAPPAPSPSQAPPLPRPSLTAPKTAERVAEHREVDPAELTVVAGPSASAVNEAAASAFSASTPHSGAAPALPSASTSVSGEVVSGAVSASAMASAVFAGDARGHASEHADDAAGLQHDHRPHAHELRERLARRAAAQRAAAASPVAAQAAQAAPVAAERAEAEREPSARPAAASAVSSPGTTSAAARGPEPARTPEPAPAAVAAAAAAPAATATSTSVKPGSRSRAPAEAAAATRPATDTRRPAAAKPVVPVEPAPKGRGLIYAALIAAAVVLFVMLQRRKTEEPEPVTEVEAPSAAAEPPAAPALAAEPAPTAAAEPAPTAAAEPPPPAEPAPAAAPSYVPPPPPPAVVAAEKPTPKPAPAAPAAKKPAAAHTRKERPAPAVVAAKPAPAPAVVEAKPAPAPAVVEAKPAAKPASAPPPAAEPTPAAAQTPLQVAMACLATGDNACVLRALEGKANGPRELELLIETHRAMGDALRAERLMQSYVDKYPSERRAATYQRQLELKAQKSNPTETAAPSAPATPAP